MFTVIMIVLAVLAAMLPAPSAFGQALQAPVVYRLETCASDRNPVRRLQCYDDLTDRPADAPGPAPAVAAVPQVPGASLIDKLKNCVGDRNAARRLICYDALTDRPPDEIEDTPVPVGAQLVQIRGVEQVKGVDLFIDLPSYVGRTIILTDGQAAAADQSSVFFSTGITRSPFI